MPHIAHDCPCPCACPQSDDLIDRIRYLVEGCDQIQAFHITLDSDNGWGGLAAHVMQEMRDDYEHVPIISFGVQPWQVWNTLIYPDVGIHAHDTMNAGDAEIPSTCCFYVT